MARFFRLYGKKRGHRMTGWWLAGRVGEAFWFAAICALGVLSLSTMIVWQLLSPETNPYQVGYGFWLLVLIFGSFIGIGAVGFFYRVLTVAYSDEHRSALLKQATDAHSEKIAKRESIPPALPSLQPFTDSPGVRLAYRLPGNRPETQELVLGSFFVLAWNALTVFLGVYAIGRLVQWQPDWVLMLVGIPFFVYVAVRATRWFLISFLRSTRMGSTTIEIDDLPLVVGEGYRLSLVQYGRLAVKKISIALVCEEVATYHFGTDTRTERQEVYRQAVLEQGRCRIDWGRPLELACEFRLPTHAMHSFQSPHNAIAWKFVVEGEANRWPSYCRSFPVVVYPPARNEKRRAVAS